ncbi:hypothetical protein, conserved [Babesia bigemina]|uniref:Uncharacterized protein n=1 Tax=Babesia bigemina TaxID=5866 RepID=A0A061DAG8_BABBI|nr:hypothetical protein, conserved [Babesia bigemina]CDR95884.1 hypothetical protein, conserved [Babesia bigemina]|eukprot:XP_012768070.1 hypothetical protein, conserved [Babesia bigemina]
MSLLPRIQRFYPSKMPQTPKKGPTPNATWDLLAYESCLTCAEGGQIDKDATAIRMHVPANVWGGLDVHTQKRYLSKRKLTTAISDVEVTSFINCGGIVSAVEIVGPFSFDESGDYSVFTVASCSCLVDPDEGPLDYLVFHEMVVKRVSDEGSGGSAHCVVDLHKPRLAKVSPLTGRSCIGVQWINGGNFTTVNEKTDGDQLFLALLMKDGSIELCKFDLGCSVTYNEVVSDEKEIP